MLFLLFADYTYYNTMFPQISDAKLKEGVFDGPQICQVLKDKQLRSKLDEKELATWSLFGAVMKNFLGGY